MSRWCGGLTGTAVGHHHPSACWGLELFGFAVKPAVLWFAQMMCCRWGVRQSWCGRHRMQFTAGESWSLAYLVSLFKERLKSYILSHVTYRFIGHFKETTHLWTRIQMCRKTWLPSSTPLSLNEACAIWMFIRKAPSWVCVLLPRFILLG